MADLRDRDAVVDRWLRRARSVPAGFGPNDACLDAEVMAAWSDGGLSREALAIVRAHVIQCSRCQVLAAVMAKLEPGAALPEGFEERWAARDSGRRSGWLGWFVPLAAATAAVALWFYVPRQAPLEEGTAPASQIAQAAPPTAPPPAPAEPAQARTADPQPPKLKAEQEAPRDLKRQVNEKDARQANVARADEQRDRAFAEPKKLDTKPAAPVAAAAPPPAAMAQRSADAAGQRREQLSAAESRLSKEIISTDPAVRWRIQGAQVEKTADGGKTWMPVTTGITAVFTAGASTSATTCWLVGRGGVIALTTDGQTWRRLPFADTTDLSAVRATDGRTATVTTAGGREFSTIDGGNTWIRRDLQEN